MLARLEKWANSIRKAFDALARRIDPFGVVVALAAANAAAIALAGMVQPRACRSIPMSTIIDLELTFSSRRLAALLAAPPLAGCARRFVWSLVTTDLIFPVTYATGICALFIWAERQRRFDPTGAPIAAPVPNRNHVLLLLPLFAGAADILLENVPLFIAGLSITGNPESAKSSFINALVIEGSLGASIKFSLIFLSVLAILAQVMHNSRGIIIKRLRYSVVAVLIGALPLLVVPQGADILQRTIEGSVKWGLLRAAIALTFGAYVVWYCGRKLVQLKFPRDPKDARADWYEYFGEHIPRILGIAVLGLGATAFARAAEASTEFTAFAIGGFLVAAAVKKFAPGVTQRIGETFIRGQWRLISDLVHGVGRAIIALVIGLGFLRWPHKPEDFFHLREGAYMLLVIAWVFYLYVYTRRGRRVVSELIPWIREGYELHRDKRAVEGDQEIYRAGELFAVSEAVSSVDLRHLDKAIKRTLLAGGVISIAAIAAFTFLTVPFARTLGALIVLSMAVGSVVFFGSIATWVHERHGIPIAIIALALAALFSIWNDAHVVRRLTGTASLIESRDNIAGRFNSWRVDTASHRVVLVAAAGGGLRAAYWTAMSLAALQDSIPDFNRHLFAISSVSGGSVGASVYAALVHDSASHPSDVRCLEKAGSRSYSHCVRAFMAEDFLSPVLAKMVGPDFVQAFLPFPLRDLDRSLGLEGSWEDSYEKVTGMPTLDSGFVGLYASPLAASTVPLLFLNTTHVETGKRYIAAPLKTDMHDSQDLLGLMQSDIRLSTAAHNSARFTYVSPPGRIQRGDVELGHVVDGGYFENSGLATLREILDVIHTRDSAAMPIVIYLCNDPIPCKDRLPGLPVTPRSAVIEWLGPVKALLSTRDARGSLSRADIAALSTAKFYQLSVCDSLITNTSTAGDTSALGSVKREEQGRERVISPPLGWLLSKVARDWMDSSLVADIASPRASACRKRNAANIDSIKVALKQH